MFVFAKSTFKQSETPSGGVTISYTSRATEITPQENQTCMLAVTKGSETGSSLILLLVILI